MNYTHYDGCGCPGGHPPCSYCTDTYDCNSCGNRNYSDFAFEHKKHDYICEECWDFYSPKGFWYWFWLILLWLLCLIIFPLTVLIYETISARREYKTQNYLIPGFIRFFYEFNFTQTNYHKKSQL